MSDFSIYGALMVTLVAANLLGWNSAAALYWRRRALRAEQRLVGAIERDPKTGRLKPKIS